MLAMPTKSLKPHSIWCAPTVTRPPASPRSRIRTVNRKAQQMKSSTIRLFCAIASMGMLLNGALANAADATISAYFAPDLQDASQNQFTNTTPNAFFCQRLPETCTKHQEFTVGIEGVSFTKRVNSTGFATKTPANRRIRMTSAAGDSFIAELQIVSISQRVQKTSNDFWGEIDFNNIRGGCSSIATDGAGPRPIREFPRLCRGGSRSLTDPEVHPGNSGL
jgi:hypothetical protein